MKLFLRPLYILFVCGISLVSKSEARNIVVFGNNGNAVCAISTQTPIEVVGESDRYPDYQVVRFYSPRCQSSRSNGMTVGLVKKSLFVSPSKSGSATLNHPTRTDRKVKKSKSSFVSQDDSQQNSLTQRNLDPGDSSQRSGLGLDSSDLNNQSENSETKKKSAPLVGWNFSQFPKGTNENYLEGSKRSKSKQQVTQKESKKRISQTTPEEADSSLDDSDESSSEESDDSEVQNPQQNSTEVITTDNCPECNNPNPFESLTQWSQDSYEKASESYCGGGKYKQNKINIQSVNDPDQMVKNYSARAQGAIRRAFLALVPPEGTKGYEEIRKLTHNFQDFDSVDPEILMKKLRKSHRDCNKFVKAALSNDYSRMDAYAKSRWDYRKQPHLRANSKLVRQYCGSEKGDLLDEHFTNPSAVNAGNMGPHLKERGFINLMDLPNGFSNKYSTEATAPEGAVLVYRRVVNGKVVNPRKGVEGDVAIKTKTGYIRDFFSPRSITSRGRYALVGIYIKPGAAE